MATVNICEECGAVQPGPHRGPCRGWGTFVMGTPLVTSESGVNRSDPDGKPDFTLIDTDLLERWARHMTAHVGSKGRDNWRKASAPEDELRARQSAWRHFLAWDRGDTDEDHGAALLFNVAVRDLVRRGRAS